QGRWLLLLGENAMGKSSVLQAIALTLMKSSQRGDLHLRPERFIKHGCDEASVTLYLSPEDTPITLTMRRGSDAFEVQPSGQKVPLLGYGATRVLPRPHEGRLDRPRTSRVENLFDPHVDLTDATRWLLAIDEADQGKAREEDKAFSAMA